MIQSEPYIPVPCSQEGVAVILQVDAMLNCNDTNSKAMIVAMSDISIY